MIILASFAFAVVEARAAEYLSAAEVAVVGGGSIGLGYIGHHLRKIDVEDRSVIKGPFPGEMSIHEFLGGGYYPGKTNFLDSRFGSAITPAVFGTALTAANLTWPQKRSGKDAVQDLFLFVSGIVTTKGMTDVTKGILRRPRPLSHMADTSLIDENNDHRFLRTAFFSGHSSSSFFSAAFLNMRLRGIMRQRLAVSEYRDWRWAPPTVLFGWATFVAWSRIHAYKHYPSDVAIGAAVGYLLAELFYSFGYEKKSRADSGSPPMLRVTFSF
jgi:membrane-associated phospholipid phosphatase